MADDSMEISSDHGHNIGEDIDIDIDLTAGQVDEDYILEDASFANDYIPQPSPAPGHDDLMIDDDNTSFKMEDADFLDVDGEQHIDQQSIFPPDTPFGQHDTSTAFQEVDHQTHQIDYAYEQQVEVADHDVETNDLLGEPEKPLADVEGHDLLSPEKQPVVRDEQEPADVKPVVHETAKSYDGGSQASSPRNTTQTETLNEQPKSPPILEPLATHVAPSEHSTSGPISPALPANAKADEPFVETSTDSFTSAEVKVLYRGTEYSLFSTSESDHPDTYFLSDLSVIDKPLSNLFEAIRVIIRDELTEEDELCLTVEELGLETEEVSSLLHIKNPANRSQQTSSMASDVTMAQILILREKLLKNEGIELTPLYIILGIRPNFSSRLSALTAGAAEGKGLSSFTTLPEGSESQTDLDELDNTDGGEHEVLSELQNEEILETDTAEEGQIEASKASMDIHTNPKNESTADSANEAQTQIVNGEGAHTSQLVSNSKITAGIAASGDLDEDGDLLDYSEDEAEQTSKNKIVTSRTAVGTADNGILTHPVSPCHLPYTCFCSKCNDLLLEHYEAQNEELRHRSLSHVEEETAEEEQSIDEQAEQAAANDEHDSETKLGEENSNENEDEYDEEDYQQVGDTTEGLEDFSAINYGEHGEDGEDAENTLETFGEETLLGEDFEDNGEFTLDAFGSGTGNDYEAEVYDVEGQSLEDHEPQEHHTLSTHEDLSPDSRNLQSEYENGNKQNTDDSTAASTATMGADDILYGDGLDDEELDELDADDKPAILSNGTTPKAVVEEEDEIGYEDDEDEAVEALPFSKDASLPVKGTPVTNGKRSFAEIEFDDDLTASQGMFGPPFTKRRCL
jgi:hypothetical protein